MFSPRVDHVGIVVPNLQDYLDNNLPYSLAQAPRSEVFFDPCQKVNVIFLELQGARLEIIEPVGEDSPVAAIAAKNRSCIHHVCLAVQDIEASCSDVERQGGFIVCPPVAAVAFEGRRVAFVVLRDGLVWELLEDWER